MRLSHYEIMALVRAFVFNEIVASRISKHLVTLIITITNLFVNAYNAFAEMLNFNIVKKKCFYILVTRLRLTKHHYFDIDFFR